VKIFLSLSSPLEPVCKKSSLFLPFTKGEAGGVFHLDFTPKPHNKDKYHQFWYHQMNFHSVSLPKGRQVGFFSQELNLCFLAELCLIPYLNFFKDSLQERPRIGLSLPFILTDSLNPMRYSYALLF